MTVRDRLVERHRRTKEIALQLLAADLAQEVILRPRLHPLCECVHPQLLCHVDNGADDDRGLRICLERAQEIHIDFEHIKDIVLDIVQ